MERKKSLASWITKTPLIREGGLEGNQRLTSLLLKKLINQGKKDREHGGGKIELEEASGG